MSTKKIVILIFSVAAIVVSIKIYFIVTGSVRPTKPVNQVVNTFVITDLQKKEFKIKKSKLNEDIMKLNEYPDGIEQKMNEVAKGLSEVELEILKIEALDNGLSKDDRAMSVELMLRANSNSSFQRLISILTDITFDQKNEIEIEMRKHIIEGVSEYYDKDQVITSLEKIEAIDPKGALGETYRRVVVGLRFGKPVR